MRDTKIIELIYEGLHESGKVLRELGRKGTARVFDKHVVDISTRGDRAVSQNFLRFLRKKRFPGVLFDEELGETSLSAHPRFQVAFDDIDGTDNSHRGNGSLPYCTVITIFDSLKPRFKDALATGVLEHTSGSVWLAFREAGTHLNGVQVYASPAKKLDKESRVIVDSRGCGREIEKLADLYRNVWVDDFATSALHLAGISSGMFHGYLNFNHKAHELGAGHLLIREAGGSLTDRQGISLDAKPYDFNAKYAVIAAGTPELNKQIRSLIRK